MDIRPDPPWWKISVVFLLSLSNCTWWYQFFINLLVAISGGYLSVAFALHAKPRMKLPIGDGTIRPMSDKMKRTLLCGIGYASWGMSRRRFFLTFFLAHSQPSNFKDQPWWGLNEVLDGQQQNEFAMQQGFYLLLKWLFSGPDAIQKSDVEL